ncbi:RidA family protein [Pusillimonas sp. TS35]|uniref:RidA family protein n=1 Tax=Paracandidimonas lactea TaxID=2895524 RepID=UPI00136A9B7B|nr:RidA family protein [Paracandidimonas lactea]MYN12643.1 RidA family protein [Pusillimonas sp. TS35]
MPQTTQSPKPQGRYAPATRDGNRIFTAGMTPRRDGALIMQGKIDAQTPAEHYRPAVELAAANALRAAHDLLADGERIGRVLNMTVYVAAQEPFTTHSSIADFASGYLYDTLGDAGIGSRTAIGVQSLPGNAPVEIALVVAVAAG